MIRGWTRIEQIIMTLDFEDKHKSTNHFMPAFAMIAALGYVFQHCFSKFLS